jgi:hypothetical protein
MVGECWQNTSHSIPMKSPLFAAQSILSVRENLQETSLIGWQTWRVNVLPQKLAGKYGESIF